MPEPSNAKPLGSRDSDVKVVSLPVGVNLRIELASPTNRLPEKSKANAVGKLRIAKVLWAPLGVNLRSLPVPDSATNRLPELSKASPKSSLSPDANVLFVPSGANFKTVSPFCMLLLCVAKRLPELSKARPKTRDSPEAKVVLTP